MCERPPVNFQMIHVSIVPNRSVPLDAFARAPGTFSRSQRILLALKYASVMSPVFSVIISPCVALIVSQ